MVVFCCGTSPYEEKGFIQIKELNMKGELANIPLLLPWRLGFRQYVFIDRKLCNMLRKMLSKRSIGI